MMFCSYIPASKSTCHISTRLHVNRTCLIITRPTCLYLTHVKYPSSPTTTTRSPEKSRNEVDGHDEAPAQERPGARENLFDEERTCLMNKRQIRKTNAQICCYFLAASMRPKSLFKGSERLYG